MITWKYKYLMHKSKIICTLLIIIASFNETVGGVVLNVWWR